MNITKALEHFEWKLSNKWKPTPKDIEAYNSIIEYKELQQARNLSENESLAKLWIHQLILLNESKMYSGERSIQVIDEILNKSVYEWVKELHSKLNLMAFNSVLNKSDIKPLEDRKDALKLIKNTLEDVNECEKQFTKEIKEENVIKFVEKQITRLINKYEK